MSSEPSSNPLVISYRYIYLYLTILFVSLSIPLLHHAAQPDTRSIWQTSTTHQTIQTTPTVSPTMSPSSSTSRTPVYFLSIGGPNTMDATEHPAYAKLTAVGHEITTLVKPKAIVVISGHWQDDSLNDKSRAKINVAEEADLIYDFYGLPRRYYEYEFPNRGSPEVAERVAGLLREGGVEVEGVERGLDHGIWAGFLVGESILVILDVLILHVAPLPFSASLFWLCLQVELLLTN